MRARRVISVTIHDIALSYNNVCTHQIACSQLKTKESIIIQTIISLYFSVFQKQNINIHIVIVKIKLYYMRKWIHILKTMLSLY